MKRTFRGLIAAAAAAMSCLLMLAAFIPARALFGRDEAPGAVAAFAKSDVTGATICFTSDDFAARVSGGEALSSIVIAALPASGTLRLAGRALPCGEAVAVRDLDTLAYVPAADEAEVHTSFSFIPVFSKSGAAAEAVAVSLNLSARANAAPVARELTLPTCAGVALCGRFRVYDPDGDACTCQIVSPPRRGTVAVTETGFRYTPAAGKTGKDSFSYTATDVYGNVSAAADVTVRVEKRADKDDFVYTDLADSPSHYAALRLRDAGVLCGETLGGDSFLYPAKTVSRAEFVALVSAVTDTALPTAAVGTGLADNDRIPVWAQPYVAAAVVGGVIRGEPDGGGNRVFRGADAITRAEAAAIIDRALALPDDGREMAFADAGAVPAWAAQEVVNCAAAQVLPVFDDNTVRCASAVTREDAVQMLWCMMEYQQAQKPSGLFGIFGK